MHAPIKKQTTNLINLYFPILLCINDCANKKTALNNILILFRTFTFYTESRIINGTCK